MAKQHYFQKRTIGQLECVEIQLDSDSIPTLLVVLCHGFGASGSDLVSTAGELLSRISHEDRTRVRFLYPAAPLILDEMDGYDSRAWWPIDMMKLQMSMQTGTFRELRTEDPPELPEAKRLLEQTVDQCLTELGLDWQQCVIGGFSQGSMLATEIAFSRQLRPGGLVVWSGTVIREDAWTNDAKRPMPIPVVQSHGRQDMILPFVGAQLLCQLLTSAKADVNFLPFSGQHEISQAALDATAKMIQQLLDVKSK